MHDIAIENICFKYELIDQMNLKQQNNELIEYHDFSIVNYVNIFKQSICGIALWKYT